MSVRIAGRCCGALTILMLVGCFEAPERKSESDSKPAFSVFVGDSKRGPSHMTASDDSSSPTITRARFEPQKPMRGERLKVAAEVDGEWTAIRYEWRLNGAPFGPNAAEVSVPSISSGDLISVRMTPERGAIQGPTFETRGVMANQRPIISGLQIRRDEDEETPGEGGERWRAVVKVDDPDGDSIEVEYAWLVNGRKVGDDRDTIDLGGLKRDDEIEVNVRAFDGRSWSATARSGRIQIGNAPPQIVSTPPRPGPTGSFRYVVRAEDADPGDRLRFALRQSPKGMRVSEYDGIVTWEPEQDQAGTHSVELVVEDGKGGESSQSFVVRLVQQNSDTSPAAPR